MRFKKNIHLLLAVCLIFPAVGCSRKFNYGSTGTITGHLTMNGKPLAAGHAVVFMEPEKGFLAFGLTDENGDFRVSSWNNGQIPVGPYQAHLAPPVDSAAAAAAEKMTAEERFDHPELADPQMNKTKRVFPERYANIRTSGLEFQIEPGENYLEVEINDK